MSGGVSVKDINIRLKELKKFKSIDNDCDLETFVKVCKLKTYPEESNKCYVDMSTLMSKLTADKLVRYILNGNLDEPLMEFLLVNFGNVPVSLHLLEICIEKSYNKKIIKLLLGKLEEKRTKKIGYTTHIRSYIYPGKQYDIKNAIFKDIMQHPISGLMKLYDYEDILSIIKILNIDFNFQQIVFIPKESFIRDIDDELYVNDEAINFLKNLIQILVERNVELDVYSFGGFVGNLSTYLEESSRPIHVAVLSMIKENFDKEYRMLISKTLNIMSYYGFINTYFLEALKVLNELSESFDIDKYNEEYYEDEYQREHLDKENVHQKSTNKITNKYIKHLIPNISNTRDVLNEERTRKYANDFINFANKYNLNNNNITVDEILLCKNAFYDYDDKLRGRYNTPPGEGVETCNIFIKIWKLAKNLGLEDKKEFTSRLLEEFISILNNRENEPVCSTGWATRLINSLHGSIIDLQISPDPDKTIMKERINDYLKKVRDTLNETQQEQFDDSIALISDTGFKFVRYLLFNNLIKEILEEFKHSDFTEVQIRYTFYKAFFEMFPYE
jgi:hypothetical protein